MKKIVALNRKAKHDYFLEEFYEAGLVLTGTEIKAIRKGMVQLKDCYVSFIDNEAFVKEMFISKYEQGNIFNHDERRIRKLLLHKHEIYKIMNKVKLKGYTLVATSIYLLNGKAKLEIALAKGKTLYDKRNSEKAKTAKKEMEKVLKNYR